MLKAVWMSDPHFICEGDVVGHDPRARLDAAIDHTNANYNDAEFCFISGDMVNDGTVSDYDALNSKLEKLEIPFYPMAGNHDDRSLLRLKLPLPDTCMEKFIQYSVTAEGCLFLCLDTQKTGSASGEFCEERTTWLRQALDNAANLNVYIFMHHPPMALDLPMQDSTILENGPAFLKLLTEYNCIKYLFIGHVHRPIVGSVDGIPFATMRSILYQAPAPKPDWSWDTFAPSEEAPNLGVISITDSTVNVQYVQFCKYETGVMDQTSRRSSASNA